MRTNAPVKNRSVLKTVAVSIAAAVLTSIILLLIFAYFITYHDLPDMAADASVMLCALVSAGVGGLFTGRVMGNRGLALGLLTGFFYFFFLYVIGFFATMEVRLSAPVFGELLCSLVGGAAGGLIGVNSNSMGKRRH
jgi:putative membrane protein (TIGR04086 family)